MTDPTQTTDDDQPNMNPDPRIAAAAAWLRSDDTAYEDCPDAALRAAREMIAAADAADASPRAEPKQMTIEALRPFAELGQWLFARDLPDDTPMVQVEGINSCVIVLTRGHFKAAHLALMALEGQNDGHAEPRA